MPSPVRDLPLHHRDPFDRLLIAQCRMEQLTLVSRDSRMSSSEVEVLWQLGLVAGPSAALALQRVESARSLTT
jgi:hypothetical protein